MELILCEGYICVYKIIVEDLHLIFSIKIIADDKNNSEFESIFVSMVCILSCPANLYLFTCVLVCIHKFALYAVTYLKE